MTSTFSQSVLLCSYFIKVTNNMYTRVRACAMMPSLRANQRHRHSPRSTTSSVRVLRLSGLWVRAAAARVRTGLPVCSLRGKVLGWIGFASVTQTDGVTHPRHTESLFILSTPTYCVRVCVCDCRKTYSTQKQAESGWHDEPDISETYNGIQNSCEVFRECFQNGMDSNMVSPKILLEKKL